MEIPVFLFFPYDGLVSHRAAAPDSVPVTPL